MPASGSGDPRERSADHAALPPALADASLSDRVLILPHDAALAAIEPTAEPVAARLSAAMQRAAEAVDSGAAADALDRWVQTSRSLAGSAT